MAVNYIWIGPPTTSFHECDNDTKLKILPGHDTLGVIAMSSHCSKINYWCLDMHKDHYIALFSDNSNIKICPIEDYLNKELHNDPEADYVISIFKKLLNEERNLTRDKVTLKVLMALYLLQKQGGVVLDTNIFPSPNHEIKLDDVQANKDFIIIEIQDEKSSYDMWIQSVPPDRLEYAKECYQFWKDKFNELELKFRDKFTFDDESERPKTLGHYEQEYHDELGHMAVGAPRLNYLKNGDPEKPDKIGYFKATGDTNDTSYMAVADLGVEKWYFNTHKQSGVNPISQIYIFIQKNRCDMLALFLNDKLDFSQLPKLKYSEDLQTEGIGEKYTLLHHATLAQSTESIQLLLSKGCDPFNQFFKKTILAKAINLSDHLSTQTLEAILQPLVKLLNKLNNNEKFDKIFQEKDYSWKYWDKYKELAKEQSDEVIVVKHIMKDMLEGCNNEKFNLTRVFEATSIIELSESFKSQMKNLKPDLTLNITPQPRKVAEAPSPYYGFILEAKAASASHEDGGFNLG